LLYTLKTGQAKTEILAMFRSVSMSSKYFLFGLLFTASVSSQNLTPAGRDHVVGRLVITVADYFSEKRAETKYFVKDQSGHTYELRLAREPAGGFRTGMTVTGSGHINGAVVENAEILSDESIQTNPLAISGPELPTVTPIAGVQKTLVYNLNSAASPNNFTNDQLAAAMFAQPGTSVNTIYQANSFGAVSVSGDVVGPYAIDIPNDLRYFNYPIRG
jgi:hypothetical protein